MRRARHVGVLQMTTVQLKQDIALMAHLLRRASFGATRDELEGYLEKGYEATVE